MSKVLKKLKNFFGRNTTDFFYDNDKEDLKYDEEDDFDGDFNEY